MPPVLQTAGSGAVIPAWPAAKAQHTQHTQRSPCSPGAEQQHTKPGKLHAPLRSGSPEPQSLSKRFPHRERRIKAGLEDTYPTERRLGREAGAGDHAAVLQRCWVRVVCSSQRRRHGHKGARNRGPAALLLPGAYLQGQPAPTRAA